MKNKTKPAPVTILLALAMMTALLAGCVPGRSPAEAPAPVVSAALPEPAPAPEAANAEQAPAPAAELTPAQPSAQAQESAAGWFTGVAGSRFLVPEGFIRLDESPSIGYQYTFWHPDHEVRIVVYEIAPGYIPEGAYETDFQIAKSNPDVTYFDKGESWFVQSGYNNGGEEIFYSKESMTESGLKTFWISYPTAKREFGDAITAEFEKNFSF